ncbi:MAG: CoA-binding protein [Bacteroidetes bacterium]|nr:CoA-binding protein [Bacteroidota bacterium]
MSAITERARQFLKGKTFAIAGVSQRRDDAANYNYRTLKKKGYRVLAVNPKYDQFDGDPCYPSLKALPEKPDGLIIVTSPAITLDLVREAVEVGIPAIWMHRATGTTNAFKSSESPMQSSVSEEAVRLAEENGIQVIPGSCPMQFAGDVGHRCMGWIFRMTGGMKEPVSVHPEKA